MEATTTPAEKITQAAVKLGLTLVSEFVPWSRSRNAGEKSPSLNWKVMLKKAGRAIITTDYMQGCGHCPSYEAFNSNAPRAQAVDAECETGHAHIINGMHPRRTVKLILPDLHEVLHSLVSDGDAINYATYEDWAREFGYEEDSRKGEATYRACLEIGLKLRAAIGEEGLKMLQEAGQDY